MIPLKRNKVGNCVFIVPLAKPFLRISFLLKNPFNMSRGIMRKCKFIKNYGKNQNVNIDTASHLLIVDLN